MISLLVGLATFLMMVFYLVGKVVFGAEWPAGFATTTILLLMSMTLNAMFLGILGEYVGRIFLQSKEIGRPIIDQKLNFETGKELPVLSEPSQDMQAAE